jgi:hypothetical protein
LKQHYEAIFTINEQHPEWVASKHEKNFQCGIELQGLIEKEVQHFLHRLQEYLDLDRLAFSLRAQRAGLDDNLVLRAKRENAVAILLSLTSIALTAGNWLHSDQNFADLYSYIKNLDHQLDLDSVRSTMISANVRLLKNVTELVGIRQNLIFQSLSRMAYKHSCDLKAQFQRKGLQTLHNNLQSIFTDIVGGRLTNRYFGLTALRELVINTTIFRQSKNSVRPSVLYELASAALLSINHEEQSMRFVISYPRLEDDSYYGTVVLHSTPSLLEHDGRMYSKKIVLEVTKLAVPKKYLTDGTFNINQLNHSTIEDFRALGGCKNFQTEEYCRDLLPLAGQMRSCLGELRNHSSTHHFQHCKTVVTEENTPTGFFLSDTLHGLVLSLPESAEVTA